MVDPGVDSARRALVAQEGETLFVAPDNGILSSVLRPSSSVVHLNQPAYWLPPVSNTFHGRDLFAPVAAHLSLGAPLEALGDPIDDWVRLSGCAAAFRAGDEIAGRVVHIDRFGNIVTNIGEEMLAGMDRARVVVRIGGRAVRGLKQTYADAVRGELIVLISSSWQVEIAVRDGNAAQTLGIRLGDEVILTMPQWVCVRLLRD